MFIYRKTKAGWRYIETTPRRNARTSGRRSWTCWTGLTGSSRTWPHGSSPNWPAGPATPWTERIWSSIWLGWRISCWSRAMNTSRQLHAACKWCWETRNTDWLLPIWVALLLSELCYQEGSTSRSFLLVQCQWFGINSFQNTFTDSVPVDFLPLGYDFQSSARRTYEQVSFYVFFFLVNI